MFSWGGLNLSFIIIVSSVNHGHYNIAGQACDDDTACSGADDSSTLSKCCACDDDIIVLVTVGKND